MIKNDLYFFRRVIYQLKKKYGFQIGIYRTTETTNLQTGRKTITRMKISINKAIILPNSIFRDYGFSTSLALLNRDLQVGGLLDTSQRTIIIDIQNLPKNFEFSPNDYIVFKHKRYNIIKISEMEVADFIQLDTKQVDGEPIFEVHESCFHQKLVINEQLTMGE